MPRFESALDFGEAVDVTVSTDDGGSREIKGRINAVKFFPNKVEYDVYILTDQQYGGTTLTEVPSSKVKSIYKDLTAGLTHKGIGGPC